MKLHIDNIDFSKLFSMILILALEFTKGFLTKLLGVPLQGICKELLSKFEGENENLRKCKQQIDIINM